MNAQNVPEICYHCENGRRVVVTESYEELQPFDSNASRDTNRKKVQCSSSDSAARIPLWLTLTLL